MTPSIRSDAQANYERLLEVPAGIFARELADTSLKAIAAEAGVGIGTLYRRFPTMNDLVEATCRNEMSRLCESAFELLVGHPPLDAMRQWMERFVDYMVTKPGMAEALPAILATREGLRLHSQEALIEAVSALLNASIMKGKVRADASPSDALMALGGITLISGHEHQRSLASLLVGLLLAGLAAPASK